MPSKTTSGITDGVYPTTVGRGRGDVNHKEHKGHEATTKVFWALFVALFVFFVAFVVDAFRPYRLPTVLGYAHRR